MYLIKLELEFMKNIYHCFTKNSFLIQNKLLLNLILFLIFGLNLNAVSQVPIPDHIVVVIMEGHSYEQIIESPHSPFINSLVNDTNTALFTNSYSITNPGQPSYLQLFSGSKQEVFDNLVPFNLPFSSPNLGSALLSVGLSFKGYAEDLPSIGFEGKNHNAYVRYSNPWVNWQGDGQKDLPPSVNQPFSNFPKNFDSLPTVSFIIPNQDNNMRNGNDPDRITKGDEWLKKNLSTYINWCKRNNSLFILTFDSDDGQHNKHIATLIHGPIVLKGKYEDNINHYYLLRTIQEMYKLPPIGSSSTVNPISNCWNKTEFKSTKKYFLSEDGKNEEKEFVAKTGVGESTGKIKKKGLFLSFDVQGLTGVIEAAQLQIFTTGAYSKNFDLEVYAIENLDLGSDSLNSISNLFTLEKVSNVKITATKSRYHNIDITNYFQKKRDEGQRYFNFFITSQSGMKEPLTWVIKKNSTNAPKLLVARNNNQVQNDVSINIDEIEISPFPAKDHTILKLNTNEEEEDVRIVISSSEDVYLANIKRKLFKGENYVSIDTKSIKNGTYNLTIFRKDKHLKKELIIEK